MSMLAVLRNVALQRKESHWKISEEDAEVEK